MNIELQTLEVLELNPRTFLFLFRGIILSTKRNFGSSCSLMFYKIGVPESFAKFTGKHLYQSLLFDKIAGLQPPTLIKKRLIQVFP